MEVTKCSGVGWKAEGTRRIARREDRVAQEFWVRGEAEMSAGKVVSYSAMQYTYVRHYAPLYIRRFAPPSLRFSLSHLLLP